jgi:DNA replication and repair protein RecF
MELSRLSLMNFRCFERRDFEFPERMNFFVGPNAIGKTSILEAICVLLRLQSPRVSALGRITRHGSAGFSVQGECNGRLLQFYFGSRRKKLAMDRVEQTEATEYLQVGRLVYFGNTLSAGLETVQPGVAREKCAL